MSYVGGLVLFVWAIYALIGGLFAAVAICLCVKRINSFGQFALLWLTCGIIIFTVNAVCT